MVPAPTPRPRARTVDSVKAAQTKQLRREAGRWLSSKREAAGITQAQLAEHVGYRYYTFVSQVEGGHGRVPSENFAQWAELLDIPPQIFTKTLLNYYEPDIYRLLFPGE